MMLPWKDLGENLLHTFLFASGVASNPWQSLVRKHITPVSTSVFTRGSPLSVSSLVPERAIVILDWDHTHFNLTVSAKALFSKFGHIHGSGRLVFA